MSQHRYKGFTIIELMLAMSFVSILLVSVAMLTIQISHIYTRGITMKEVNQAGTEITDDIRRSIANSYVDGIEARTSGNKKLICTGTYSYIANDPADIENNTSNLVKYANGTVVRLTKIRDTGGQLCKDAIPTVIPASTEATELLAGGDRSLVVRKMELMPTVLNNESRGLFILNLTLSSGVTEELSDDESQCRPPSEEQSGAEYCAIDTFTSVTRVGNTYKN